MNGTQMIGALVMALLVTIVIACLFGAAQIVHNLRNRRRPGRFMANIGEGVRGEGYITKLSSAAMTTRYLLVKFGADVDHITISSASHEQVLGVCIDEAVGAEEYVTVALLGCFTGTIRMVASAAIVIGAFVASDGTGKAITLTPAGGGKYQIGVALTAAAQAGDIIEVAHCAPIRRDT